MTKKYKYLQFFYLPLETTYFFMITQIFQHSNNKWRVIFERIEKIPKSHKYPEHLNGNEKKYITSKINFFNFLKKFNSLLLEKSQLIDGKEIRIQASFTTFDFRDMDIEEINKELDEIIQESISSLLFLIQGIQKRIKTNKILGELQEKKSRIEKIEKIKELKSIRINLKKKINKDKYSIWETRLWEIKKRIEEIKSEIIILKQNISQISAKETIKKLEKEKSALEKREDNHYYKLEEQEKQKIEEEIYSIEEEISILEQELKTIPIEQLKEKNNLSEIQGKLQEMNVFIDWTYLESSFEKAFNIIYCGSSWEKKYWIIVETFKASTIKILDLELERWKEMLEEINDWETIDSMRQVIIFVNNILDQSQLKQAS